MTRALAGVAALAAWVAAASGPPASSGTVHRASPDARRAGATGAEAAPAASDVAAATRVPAADSNDWRFPVGERSEYEVYVRLGPVGAPRPLGSASLEVEAVEEVDGVRAYRAALELEGGIPLVYRMDNRQVSWIATSPVRSLRFAEKLREGDYRRDRRYRLDQAAGTYTRFDRAGASGEYRAVEGHRDVPMPENALDEVSFLYLVRTLPLKVGETYRLRRFFEEDGNPVVLEVLRRETVRVPAGRFSTIVVRPVLRTDGLFSKGGRAEVYLSDDERRVIVQIRSRMKVGTVDMYLTAYRPGATAGATG